MWRQLAWRLLLLQILLAPASNFPVELDISMTADCDVNHDGVHFYCIKVTPKGYQGAHVHTVKRRYNRFRDLRAALDNFTHAEFPTRYMNAFCWNPFGQEECKEEGLNSRRKGLELWLKEVLAHDESTASWNNTIEEFLEFDAGIFTTTTTTTMLATTTAQCVVVTTTTQDTNLSGTCHVEKQPQIGIWIPLWIPSNNPFDEIEDWSWFEPTAFLVIVSLVSILIGIWLFRVVFRDDNEVDDGTREFFSHSEIRRVMVLDEPDIKLKDPSCPPSDPQAPPRFGGTFLGSIRRRARANSDESIFDLQANAYTFNGVTGDDSKKPLVIFVNSGSGGQQGVALLEECRSLGLHQYQVVDMKSAPDVVPKALKFWSESGYNYRVLVCGGDGTAAWILDELANLELESGQVKPPVAILPLGTGNDLSRVLGWGGGYEGGDLWPIFRRIYNSKFMQLDRWNVTLQQDNSEKKKVMCNYLGIGCDAAIALDFHETRTRNPGLFIARPVNKLFYMCSGARAQIQKASANIVSKINVTCDGERLELDRIDQTLEGVIVLNVRSFGGGSDLWGEVDKDSKFTNSLCDDKRLEVVGVHGAFSLGANQLRLYQPVRLAQANLVEIETTVMLPVQLDGEPARFEAGTIRIDHRDQAVMLGDVGLSVGATNLIDWAITEKVIDQEQYKKMQAEIARRAVSTRRY